MARRHICSQSKQSLPPPLPRWGPRRIRTAFGRSAAGPAAAAAAAMIQNLIRVSGWMDVRFELNLTSVSNWIERPFRT